MTTPQSAIVPDHCKAGIFIEADALPGREADIKQACLKSLDALTALQQQFPEANLGLTIAFGSSLWQQFGHTEEGKKHQTFPSARQRPGTGHATRFDDTHRLFAPRH